jgi:hypothetical protein
MYIMVWKRERRKSYRRGGGISVKAIIMINTTNNIMTIATV